MLARATSQRADVGHAALKRCARTPPGSPNTRRAAADVSDREVRRRLVAQTGDERRRPDHVRRLVAAAATPLRRQVGAVGLDHDPAARRGDHRLPQNRALGVRDRPRERDREAQLDVAPRQRLVAREAVDDPQRPVARTRPARRPLRPGSRPSPRARHASGSPPAAPARRPATADRGRPAPGRRAATGCGRSRGRSRRSRRPPPRPPAPRCASARPRSQSFASCGWKPTAANTSGSARASATAASLSGRSVPTVTIADSPAARARASTAARSVPKARSCRCAWLSIRPAVSPAVSPAVTPAVSPAASPSASGCALTTPAAPLPARRSRGRAS